MVIVSPDNKKWRKKRKKLKSLSYTVLVFYIVIDSIKTLLSLSFKPELVYHFDVLTYAFQ